MNNIMCTIALYCCVIAPTMYALPGRERLMQLVPDSVVRKAERVLGAASRLIDQLDDRIDNRQYYSLVLAILERDASALQGAIDQGKDIHRAQFTYPAIGTSSITPLMACAYRGFAEGIRILLDAGADPGEVGIRMSDFPNTALGLARFHGHEAAAQILEERESVLSATLHGNLSKLRSLLAQGGNPDSCNRFGMPALAIAARSGQIDVVDALVRAGASIVFFDEGISPLHCAIRNRQPDVVTLLLQHIDSLNNGVFVRRNLRSFIRSSLICSPNRLQRDAFLYAMIYRQERVVDAIIQQRRTEGSVVSDAFIVRDLLTRRNNPRLMGERIWWKIPEITSLSWLHIPMKYIHKALLDLICSNPFPKREQVDPRFFELVRYCLAYQGSLTYSLNKRGDTLMHVVAGPGVSAKSYVARYLVGLVPWAIVRPNYQKLRHINGKLVEIPGQTPLDIAIANASKKNPDKLKLFLQAAYGKKPSRQKT